MDDLKFDEKFLAEVTDEAPRVFTKTETMAEYLARGGKITKGPSHDILWSYTVRSTKSQSQRYTHFYNTDTEE